MTTKTINNTTFANFQEWLIANGYKQEGEGRTKPERTIKGRLEYRNITKHKEGKNIFYPLEQLEQAAQDLTPSTPDTTAPTPTTDNQPNVAELRQYIEKLEKELEKYSRLYNETASDQIEIERDLKETKAKANRDVIKLRESLNQHKNRLESQNKKVESLKNQLENQNQTESQRLQKTKTDNAKLGKSLNEAKAKINTLEIEKAALKAKLEDEKTKSQKLQNEAKAKTKKSKLFEFWWLVVASLVTALLTARVAFFEFSNFGEAIENQKIPQEINFGLASVFFIAMVTVNYFMPSDKWYKQAFKYLTVLFLVIVEFSAIGLALDTFKNEFLKEILGYCMTFILPLTNVIFTSMLANRIHKMF